MLLKNKGTRKMAKLKNHVIYDNDRSVLQRLAEEYQMIGRDTKLEPDRLIIFALPRRKQKNENVRKTRRL